MIWTHEKSEIKQVEKFWVISSTFVADDGVRFTSDMDLLLFLRLYYSAYQIDNISNPMRIIYQEAKPFMDEYERNKNAQ